jgi:ABC-type nitrate/sulfonate/bicarbonate transport system substrate-binding protein
MFGWTSASSILASLTASAITLAAESESLVAVTISHQGPVYWALPIYNADEEGYFDDLKLDVSCEVYPSGAPQVSAVVENKTWISVQLECGPTLSVA